MSDRRQAAWIWAAVIAWIAVQYLVVCDLPLLSDDHVLLAAGQQWHSVADLLAAEPRRPLQHALFALGALCGDGAPAVMRAAGGVLYLGALVLIGAVGRQIGMSSRRAALAAALFALFPAGTTIWWPAAVSSSGRLCATLLAWWAFGRADRTADRDSGSRRVGGRAHGVLACAATAIALGFHQAAVLLPLLLALQQWARATANAPRGSGWAHGLRATVHTLSRRPASWCIVAIVGAATVWFRSTPHPYHGARAPMAIVASLSWATAGLWPEALRVLAVDGVRGEHGLYVRLLGGGALVLFAMAAALAVWRDRGWLRCAVLAATAELAFASIGAGWTARYAFVAAAFVVLGTVRSAARRWHVVVLAITGVLWLADSVRALLDFTGAIVLSHTLVTDAAAVRRALPADVPLFVLDVPAKFGAAGDVPLGNWGFAEAVHLAGAAGDVRLVRTHQLVASSAAAFVTAAEAQQLRDTATVLEFDAGSQRFVHWQRGERLLQR